MNPRLIVLAVTLALVSFCERVSAATGSKAVGDLLKASSKSRAYQRVGIRELQRAESLFLKTLTWAESDAELIAAWSELGWSFEPVEAGNVVDVRENQEKNRSVWILRERDDDRRGRGFFAFRRDASAIYLQAPHSYYDKRTRRITLDLFSGGSVSAAAWNTVRRAVLDVAHSRDSYMNAFTRAVLQTEARHVILQLHGFSPQKRSTDAGRMSEIIVSNGTRFPGRIARRVCHQLAQSWPDTARLFPSQVGELGGTTNAQARIVHQHGYDSFVHLELASDIRESLGKNRALQDRLHDALISSLSSLLDEST